MFLEDLHSRNIIGEWFPCSWAFAKCFYLAIEDIDFVLISEFLEGTLKDEISTQCWLVNFKGLVKLGQPLHQQDWILLAFAIICHGTIKLTSLLNPKSDRRDERCRITRACNAFGWSWGVQGAAA